MKVNVDLNDSDIFLHLYLLDDFKAGVLTKFLEYFDEGYEIWEEEEKQRDIDKIIYQINDALLLGQKKRLIAFMERLIDKLKE